MNKKLMVVGLLVGALIVSTVSGAYLTYKGFVEIYGTKYPLGIVELETIPIAPIEGLEAREDYLGEIRVWTYSDKAQVVLQLVQLSQIVSNFRSFTVKVKLDLDIVFVVDLTYSMDGYLDTVKGNLMYLMGVLYMMNKRQVQVGVVGFWDEEPAPVSFPLTQLEYNERGEEISGVGNFIEGLTVSGGAGIPQSHYLGFETALELFKEKDESWVHDRVIVFVSDAEAGFNDQRSFGEARDAVLDLADAGIKVHSVLCGPDEWPENVELRWYADVTGGHFIGPEGQDRIVPGVTRDPTWIVKLTPVTPFDSFRLPLRSSEPTRKEGFYTFHIYVDFWCKAVPWHEWFLTELTAHLEKAEIPPIFPPPLLPVETGLDISIGVWPIIVNPDDTTDVTYEITPGATNPEHVTLFMVEPDGTTKHPLYSDTDLGPKTVTFTVPSVGPLGTWEAVVVYDYEYMGYHLSAEASADLFVED